ncbi:MAG TPA: hypothetical protein VMT67_17095 [Terriglobales bacterium]|nr:hypothetical protein [Terriglobales bacterium]
MLMPEFFDKADAAVKVALIAACASLVTSLVTVAHSLFGAPLKYWLEKKALRNKLAAEYEYEQRKSLRTLIGRHQGQMLEAADTLNHRIWNLYRNHDKGWLDAHGRYKETGYYHFSFVYRFLNLFTLLRQFEREAVLIDTRIAERKDLDFVKFGKALSWAICDVALFENLEYDSTYATDHFFKDDLREICDACMTGETFPGHEQLRAILNSRVGSDKIHRFFDGLQKDENRFRWDRIVVVDLLLMAFVNTFGYDMQQSTEAKFVEAASQATHRAILENLASWLPKLGLNKNPGARLIARAIAANGLRHLESVRATAV